MSAVMFSLEPGKPPVEFRFNTKTALQLEEVAGAAPQVIAQQGQAVRALVLMVWFGLLHQDAAMDKNKATRLIEQFLKSGGKAKDLSKALVKAMNTSGVYGDPDVPDGLDEEETVAADPPSPTTPTTTD